MTEIFYIILFYSTLFYTKVDGACPLEAAVEPASQPAGITPPSVAADGFRFYHNSKSSVVFKRVDLRRTEPSTQVPVAEK